MKHLVLFLLFVFCSTYALFAQEIDEDFMINKDVPGYIIMTNNDTILGKVKIATRSKNQVRVKFTPQNSFKTKTYKAKDKKLLGYGYTTQQNNDTKQIVFRNRDFLLKEADQPPVPFSSNTVFMEIKATGQVNLYSYYVESNTQVASTYLHYYFMDAKYSDNTEETRERKVMREDFERITESFTEDCPIIRNKINIAYDYSNLDRIVAEYNNCQNKKNLGGTDCSKCEDEIRENERKLKELQMQKRLKDLKEASDSNK
jgi:hypothetical protein